MCMMCVFLSRSTSAVEVARNGLIRVRRVPLLSWPQGSCEVHFSGKWQSGSMHLKGSRDISGCALHGMC